MHMYIYTYIHRYIYTHIHAYMCSTLVFCSKKDGKYLCCSLPDYLPCQICYLCLASKGNEDFDYVYTNLAPDAAWRTDHRVPDMWTSPPAMSCLRDFHAGTVALDLLHIFHLGILRDLLGTGLKLVCLKKNEFYSGNTIAKRLDQLTRELFAWAKQHKLELSLRKVHKGNLVWKGNMCPELRCKGADALTCLRFLTAKVQVQSPLKYPGIVGCLWAAERFIGCLAHGSLFLLESESLTAYTTGLSFLHSYVGLAGQAVAANEFFFKVRPKYHLLVHVVESLKPVQNVLHRNPFFDATFGDEDYVKHLLNLKKKMSRRTASLNVLRRFLVMNKSNIDALL